MAKKKVETPVYPVAPLKITKDKFCELLLEQIKKGRELNEVEVPRTPQHTSYYGGGFLSPGRITDRVDYNDAAENAFVADYKRWSDRCKSIYQTSFTEAESSYFHDFESQIGASGVATRLKSIKVIFSVL